MIARPGVHRKDNNMDATEYAENLTAADELLALPWT